MDQIVTLLENIVDKLDIIIENQKYKGLGTPNILDCVSKDYIPRDEKPFPTPWNTDYVLSCEGDYLNSEEKRLTNELYS